jgi:hypothetical protein
MPWFMCPFCRSETLKTIGMGGRSPKPAKRYVKCSKCGKKYFVRGPKMLPIWRNSHNQLRRVKVVFGTRCSYARVRY